MKISSHTNRAFLLGIALLGASTFIGFAAPASAQPRRDTAPNLDNREEFEAREMEREDDTTAPQDFQQRGEFGERRGGRRRGPDSGEAGRPGFQGRGGGRGARGRGPGDDEGQMGPRHRGPGRPDFQNGDGNGFQRRGRANDGEQGRFEGRGRGRGPSRREFRNGPDSPFGPRKDRRDFEGQGGFGPRGRNRPGSQNRPENEGIFNPNSGVSSPGNSFTGTVTGVRSNQSFDVRIGNKTFNVYTLSPTPSGLSQGDTVRINGIQKYNNDIRDARVSILNQG